MFVYVFTPYSKEITLILFIHLGMMNNRSMQENVNEGNKQPPASAKIDDTVMCGYKAILLSPG